MTRGVVIARRRGTFVNVDVTDDASESRCALTGVLSHAVNTGTVIGTRRRSTVVHVHLTPLACQTFIIIIIFVY